jgi:hypothetical protein
MIANLNVLGSNRSDAGHHTPCKDGSSHSDLGSVCVAQPPSAVRFLSKLTHY